MPAVYCVITHAESRETAWKIHAFLKAKSVETYLWQLVDAATAAKVQCINIEPGGEY